jgi:hypothetical protein
MPRSGMQIDRMKVEIPGVSAEAGRRIALLVAAGLAEAGAMPATGDIPALSIELVADHRVDASELARRIVAATLRHLQLSP